MSKKKGRSWLSDKDRRAIRQELLSRKIYKFYEVLSKWAPIPLMLGHWYGVWDYGHYPRPVIVDTDDNGNCIIWLYILAYVYMPIMMIPVSLFFKYCWIYRIPFFYFFGVNAIRIYYQSWMIRPDQLVMHHRLIFTTLIVYCYGFIKIACKGKKCCSYAREQ